LELRLERLDASLPEIQILDFESPFLNLLCQPLGDLINIQISNFSLHLVYYFVFRLVLCEQNILSLPLPVSSVRTLSGIRIGIGAADNEKQRWDMIP